MLSSTIKTFTFSLKMTNWQMEIGRMTLYILFPIGIYYYFNQTDNIEEWIQTERKKLAPDDEKKRADFKQFVYEYNKKQDLKALAEMEMQYQGMK
ncbi:protein PET100 homolog, mitochondrial [Ceratina calcarata]|uniref:Protein PET100 homolog, mitochondrial n=1 Tax=Ceratina calcarata TaxID=156304 RepID=A0AAJ7W9Y9_9HYME|nr:protein PET100 homolog, mitochondrial [Ceratina calcarata]